jgi:hypothetical protein
MAQSSASKLFSYFASREFICFQQFRKFFWSQFTSLSLVMNKVCMFHFLKNCRHGALWISSVWSISSQNPGRQPYESVLYDPFPHKFPSLSLIMSKFYRFHSSQNSGTEPYDQFCMVHTLIPNVSIFTFNIIIPSTPISSKWSRSLTFRSKNFLYSLHTSTCMLHCKPISSSIQ